MPIGIFVKPWALLCSQDVRSFTEVPSLDKGGIHTRNFGGYGSHRTNIHGISRRDLPLGKSSMIGQHINDPQHFFLGIVKMCRYPDAAETERFDDFMIPKNLV